MAVSDRQHRRKPLAESIATLEEQLFKAEQIGNTKKVKALKIVLKRLKRNVDISNATSLYKRTREKEKVR